VPGTVHQCPCQLGRLTGILLLCLAENHQSHRSGGGARKRRLQGSASALPRHASHSARQRRASSLHSASMRPHRGISRASGLHSVSMRPHRRISWPHPVDLDRRWTQARAYLADSKLTTLRSPSSLPCCRLCRIRASPQLTDEAPRAMAGPLRRDQEAHRCRPARQENCGRPHPPMLPEVLRCRKEI